MAYKLTKREKQQELSSRVDQAKAIGKTAFKNEKKRVDNHASSVASRSRRVYLISSYEALVERKIQESSRLAALLFQQRAVDEKQKAHIRRMQVRIDALTREVKQLKKTKAKIPATQSTDPSSCDSLTQNNAWPQEFNVDVPIPYDNTTATTAPSSRYVQPDAVPFNSPLDPSHPQGGSFDVAAEQPSVFATYLERDPASAPAEGLQAVEDCLKMESGDWGPMHMINFKDAQAQMKADTPSNVLHPAV